MTHHYNLSELAQQAQARAERHELEERIAVLEAALLDIQRELDAYESKAEVLYTIANIVRAALGGFEE